jgi:hypothetical protein
MEAVRLLGVAKAAPLIRFGAESFFKLRGSFCDRGSFGSVTGNRSVESREENNLSFSQIPSVVN